MRDLGMGHVIQQVVTGPFLVNTRIMSGPAIHGFVKTGSLSVKGKLSQPQLGKSSRCTQNTVNRVVTFP